MSGRIDDDLANSLEDPCDEANKALNGAIDGPLWLNATQVEEDIEIELGEGRTVVVAISEVLGRARHEMD